MADLLPQYSIVMTTNGACPTGYSAYDTLNGNYLRSTAIVNTTPSGGNTHNHTGANHTHSLTTATGSTTVAITYGSGGTRAMPHTHPVNLTSGNPTGLTINTVNHEPLWANMKLCRKD